MLDGTLVDPFQVRREVPTQRSENVRKLGNYAKRESRTEVPNYAPRGSFVLPRIRPAPDFARRCVATVSLPGER